MTTAVPPAWTRALLTAALPLRDRESISGDLLEEYRESIEPQRGKTAANRWYLRQVLNIALRAHIVWAVLFAAIFVGRAAVDAFVPVHDFSARSAITTYGAMAIWMTAGFTLTWRTALLRSATLGGFFAAVLASLLNYPITAALIGFIVATNNELAWAGIQSSGGAGEMFVMPAIVLIPATLFATLGGTTALLLRRLRA
jgi:hypothetical protein